MLVTIKDLENGIQQITNPNGNKLQCYGKASVSIDCPIEFGNSYYFEARTNSGETISQTITINEETVNDLIKMQYSEENANLTLDLDYASYKNKYYKFGEAKDWTTYTGQFDMLVEDAVKDSAYDETTKTTTIYLKGTDDLGNEVIIEKQIPIKAELPKLKLIFRNKQTDMNIETLKQDIKTKLAQNNISAGFMDIALGGEELIQSNGEDAQTIFNTWGRVGYTGQWYYDAATKSIINSENTNNLTGFYYSKTMNYNEIELQYNNTTTNADDDMMGCMIRFNKNSNGTVTTYLFALDRHDNGGGINNGAKNGLLKITGKKFEIGNVTVLQKINKVWKRNEWINYKIIAKDNNIKVYMNGELVINYTDNSNPILTGSYGFFSYSQADSRYKDIQGKGFKYYSLLEAVNLTSWDKETNCIININNEAEDGLTQETADAINNNNLYYIGVTTEDYKEDVDNFSTLINGRGQYINSTNYEQMVNDIVEYIKTIKQ